MASALSPHSLPLRVTHLKKSLHVIYTPLPPRSPLDVVYLLAIALTFGPLPGEWAGLFKPPYSNLHRESNILLGGKVSSQALARAFPMWEEESRNSQ
jgi:hypothetical protein